MKGSVRYFTENYCSLLPDYVAEQDRIRAGPCTVAAEVIRSYMQF